MFRDKQRLEEELRKDWNGMITVEMAYIVPVILFIFFLSVIGIFYYHDKEILTACAYESAAAASVKEREDGGVLPDTVCTMFRERIRGKCILFSDAEISVEIEEGSMIVNAEALKGKMRITVRVSASLTDPEQTIRQYRRIKWNLQ